MDKKIYEALTIEELNKEIKHDSLFKYTYDQIKLIKDSVLKSESQIAEWADISYRRIFNYVTYFEDTSVIKKVNSKSKKRWSEQFGEDVLKADSIINYWKAFKDSMDLKNFAKLELTILDKEYYQYVGGISNINVGFLVTPLKGAIQQMKFKYTLVAKIDSEQEESRRSVLSLLNYSVCNLTRPVAKPSVFYWEANYRNREIMEGRTVSEVLRDYDVKIEIMAVRIGGENKTSPTELMPEIVNHYFNYGSSDGMEDYYRDKIVKEMINKDYKSEIDLLLEDYKIAGTEKDDRVYKFLHLAE